MIVDEEKEKVKILNEREIETYLVSWDNCNVNPTFNNLSWIYDDILYLLKNKHFFDTSIAKFNDLLDSMMRIIFSNSKTNKTSIDNWYKLYDDMQILVMMYKVKYLTSINDNVNPYCLKVLQEKNPRINNFSIENITKEKFFDCDICDNNNELSMGYNNGI